MSVSKSVGASDASAAVPYISVVAWLTCAWCSAISGVHCVGGNTHKAMVTSGGGVGGHWEHPVSSMVAGMVHCAASKPDGGCGLAAQVCMSDPVCGIPIVASGELVVDNLTTALVGDDGAISAGVA